MKITAFFHILGRENPNINDEIKVLPKTEPKCSIIYLFMVVTFIIYIFNVRFEAIA